jgi:DHA2 family methylenomycin A resistance protein-like MFS transporter
VTSLRLPSTRPAAGRPAARRRTLALLGVSLGYFMVLLDMTVLSVAEPDLAASLDASLAGLQWTTTAYTVVFGALLPAAGAAADRYGAHRVFRWGVAAFGAVSLLSAAAPTLAALVGLRALLGVAGAACVPASLALVGRLYPEPAARARAVATWAAISGTAVAAGPLAGGLLVEAAGWRAVFLVNVPVAALVLLLVAGEAVRCPSGARRIDWPGHLAGGAALALLTGALIAAGARAAGYAVLAGAAAVGAFAVFAARERRAAAPVVDRALLAAGGVRAGLAAGAAVNCALSGSLFVLPLLWHDDLGPAGTGLAFLPLTVPFVVDPPLVGRLTARFGARPPVLTGLGLVAAGSAALAWAAGSGGGHLPYLPGMLLTGVGISFALPALVTAVVAAAPAGTAGAAAGLLTTVRQVGAALGVAVMGALLHLDAPAGAVLAFAVPAVLCAAAALPFAAARRGPAA